MNPVLAHRQLKCDLCIVGGGLSGSFAALAAARHGKNVILMQDRPMLGGNASSEIRMWVRGAHGPYNRETGLISELEERNIHGNPTLVSSVFDATLYGMLMENPNIQLLMNTSCMDAEVKDGKIVSVSGWQLTTYTYFTVFADIFADCSGNSILAPLTGANFRYGREAIGEFGESLAIIRSSSSRPILPQNSPPMNHSAGTTAPASTPRSGITTSAPADATCGGASSAATSTSFRTPSRCGTACWQTFTESGTTSRTAATTAWKTGSWNGSDSCPVSGNPAGTSAA